MTTAQKLETRYRKAVELNNKLASEIEGKIATGLTATFFVNANKEVVRVQKMIKKALVNGEITIEEYKSIIA